MQVEEKGGKKEEGSRNKERVRGRRQKEKMLRRAEKEICLVACCLIIWLGACM